MTALSGRTTERKTTISKMKDRISTAPMTTKSRLPRKAAASMRAAVSPPTCALTSVPLTTGGITSERRVCTSVSVCADWGDVVGDDR